jgi:hypothetical protein
MMVTFGIEVVANFDLYNKSLDVKNWLGMFFDEGFYLGFLKHLKKKHLRIFNKYDDGSGKPSAEIYESDLHDAKSGGRDDYRADAVELFIFSSHGNHTKDYQSLVAFNSSTARIGTSKDWKFGDTRLRWLIIYACRLIVLQEVLALLPMFQGLRMYCGSMWSLGFDDKDPNSPGMRSSTHIGESIGENLNDGMPVSSAYVYGCKDDELPTLNVPMVLTAEFGYSLVKNENESWKLMLTTLNTDTLSSSKDAIPPRDIKWLNYYWAEI